MIKKTETNKSFENVDKIRLSENCYLVPPKRKH